MQELTLGKTKNEEEISSVSKVTFHQILDTVRIIKDVKRWMIHIVGTGLTYFTLGAHAQRGSQYLVSVSVRLLPRFLPPRVAKKRHQRGSALHWLYFKNGDFRESATFRSYGVKTKCTSQLQISTGLPRPGPLALCVLKA